ncbi:MAG: SDR family oxidoreductase [Gammaproteobacteria bacterium]
MTHTSVITGANRGIGLALATLCQQRGEQVITVCRHASDTLKTLGVHIIDGIDLSDPHASQTLREALAGQHIDTLINNAGILENETLGQLKVDSIMAQFQINALAPLLITEALLPNLQAGAKIAFITSRMGSMGDNTSGGRYGYRMSKAALNAAAVSLARDLTPKQIAVAILHPGFVATDMVGGRGDLLPEQAAAQLLARLDALSLEQTGQFLHSNGSTLPW